MSLAFDAMVTNVLEALSVQQVFRMVSTTIYLYELRDELAQLTKQIGTQFESMFRHGLFTFCGPGTDEWPGSGVPTFETALALFRRRQLRLDVRLEFVVRLAYAYTQQHRHEVQVHFRNYTCVVLSVTLDQLHRELRTFAHLDNNEFRLASGKLNLKSQETQLEVDWLQAFKNLEAGSPALVHMTDVAKRQVIEARRSGTTPLFVLDLADHTFPRPLVRGVMEEIPEIRFTGRQGCFHRKHWKCWRNDLSDSPWTSSKNIMTDRDHMGLATTFLYSILRSGQWLRFLQDVYGIEERLIPQSDGAGIQNTAAGGYLGLHVDFNAHRNLLRRINIFVYLNDDWQESYGGHLDIWNMELTDCTSRILPVFGRIVSFLSSDLSYHGHPTPLKAPGNRSRRSLSQYYYSHGRPSSECRDGDCLRAGLGGHSTEHGKVNCNHCSGDCCRSVCESLEPSEVELYR